jgi:hypothetical protein
MMSPSSWYKTFMASYGVDVGSYKPTKAKPGPIPTLRGSRQGRAALALALLHQHLLLPAQGGDAARPACHPLGRRRLKQSLAALRPVQQVRHQGGVHLSS